MPFTRLPMFEFNQRKQQESWILISQFQRDLQAFKDFVNKPDNVEHKRFGAYAINQVKDFCPEVEKEVGPAAVNLGMFIIYLYESANQNFVVLSKGMEDSYLVWSCWKSEQARREHEVDLDLDGVECLRKMALLAVGNRPGVRLILSEQEDKSFMWKAPMVHPLQMLENTYQRIVHKAVKQAILDPLKAQSETLAQYFVQDAGRAEYLKFKPIEEDNTQHLAAVRMNHLIDTFYLFRLLVQYRVESSAVVSDDLRADLSGSLTKLLHNGDPSQMGWLSAWLTKKISEIGKKVNALNTPSKKRVIFFVKGGRALNFFLGTPEKGENDWDTQVVINPSLSAEEWYQCFTEVHDVLLATLTTFKAEFTALVRENSALFAKYLKDNTGPKGGEDEEIDKNEASDVSSAGDHATCKAELIDIGIPRRDSASALEEWTRLSPPHALLQEASGVIYPHREYYLNEYLMMVRDAFIANADVKKAPKRIKRFGLVLDSDKGLAASPLEEKRLAALPETAKKIATLAGKPRQQLFRLMIAEFVEAYNLIEDKELATYFDKQCVASISNPPALSVELAAELDDAQKALATDVGVAHQLSNLMNEHWKERNTFFEEKSEFFADFVRKLSTQMNPLLQKVQAQFAVAGSYASRLHADHLRLQPVGLEPIRRVLIKLQCAQGCDRAQVLAVANDIVRKAADETKLINVIDGEKLSLLLYWHEKVKIGDFTYKPLVMKIRVAEQKGNRLPVLASVDGLPVLDLRYLVADYLHKTSKIDERGSRRVLASATAAVSEMLSWFDFDSDEAG